MLVGHPKKGVEGVKSVITNSIQKELALETKDKYLPLTRPINHYFLSTNTIMSPITHRVFTVQTGTQNKTHYTGTE